MFEKEYISLVPGPVQVNQKILDALSKQVVTHLHEDWASYYNSVCDKLKRIFMTKGEVFLMASSGTGAMEAAVSSTVNPGEKILVLSNGLFGDRISVIAKGYNLEAEVIEFPTTVTVQPERLKERLDKGLGNIAAVGVVYSESQNGVLNPIKEIARICNEYDVPLIVDVVSALAGVEFRMDEWGVDIAVCATQKCIGGVVGMSMVAVNDKAWKYIENKKGTGFYFNLNIWRDSIHNNGIHPHPWSMSETLVFSLDAAADLILQEGLEARWKRHWDIYDFYARELGRIGFDMFIYRENACPTVISINRHPDISVEDLRKRLKDSYGILIGVGIYQQKGRIWRIGNMAEQATIKKAEKLVQAVTEIIRTL
jgi:Serine-pyruvate aminotransferase/archaeal aspartate aminotransferase